MSHQRLFSIRTSSTSEHFTFFANGNPICLDKRHIPEKRWSEQESCRERINLARSQHNSPERRVNKPEQRLDVTTQPLVGGSFSGHLSESTGGFRVDKRELGCIGFY